MLCVSQLTESSRLNETGPSHCTDENAGTKSLVQGPRTRKWPSWNVKLGGTAPTKSARRGRAGACVCLASRAFVLRGEPGRRCRNSRVTRPALKQEPFLPQTPDPAAPNHWAQASVFLPRTACMPRAAQRALAWFSGGYVCSCVSQIPGRASR